MTVCLLGPARDLHGRDDPFLLRRRFKERMAAMGAAAVLMEEVPDRPEEPHIAKFLRIVEDHGVNTYAVVVALESRLHGVSVEIGHLLTRIHDEVIDSSRVHLLLEASLGETNPQGELALNESGNRTRYYADLIDAGCPMHRWRNVPELVRHAVAVAVEDAMHANDEQAQDNRGAGGPGRWGGRWSRAPDSPY